MMPSESPPGSRTGEGHAIFFQVLQFETRTIFSRLQGGEGEFFSRGSGTGCVGGEPIMKKQAEKVGVISGEMGKT